jgi:hypothetical protein
VVGVTRVVGVPENDTSPRLTVAGTRSTKCLAAICIAWKRVGVMSVACMDSETSSAIITVARSRATRVSALGEPRETISVARATATIPKAACRRHAARLGTREAGTAQLLQHISADQRGQQHQQPQPAGGLKSHLATNVIAESGRLGGSSARRAAPPPRRRRRPPVARSPGRRRCIRGKPCSWHARSRAPGFAPCD